MNKKEPTDKWLSAPNEPLYSRRVISQPPPLDIFNRFLAVARCSQPFLGDAFSGPLPELEGRLTKLWDSEADKKSLFYAEKRNLVVQATRYLASLRILQTEDLNPLAAGQAFFTRPRQPRPFQVPISNSKPTLRSEAYEVLFLITRLFHSASAHVSLQLSSFPNAIPYIPYYDPRPSATAIPNRQRVADLARVAFHFRRFKDAPAGKQPINIFNFSRDQIQPPNLHVNVPPLSKQYYQHGAGVGSGTRAKREEAPMASAIMYFIAKIMEIQEWDIERQENAARRFDSKLQALVGSRSMLMSTVSPLLLFLRNPLTPPECPFAGSHINFWTYGCTPICVNGAVDEGVVEFECQFMDAILGAVYGAAGKTQEQVWDKLGEDLEVAVEALLESDEPVLPSPQVPVLSPPQSPQPPLPIPLPMDDDGEDAPLYPYADDAGEEDEDPLVTVYGPSHLADGSRQPSGPSTMAPPSRADSRGPSTHHQKPLFLSTSPSPSPGPGPRSRSSLPAALRLSLPPPPPLASARASIEKGKGRAEAAKHLMVPPTAAGEIDVGDGGVEEESAESEDEIGEEKGGEDSRAALSQTPQPTPQPVSSSVPDVESESGDEEEDEGEEGGRVEEPLPRQTTRHASQPSSSRTPQKASQANPRPLTGKKPAPRPTRQKRPAPAEAPGSKRPRVVAPKEPPLLADFPWRPPSAPAAPRGDYPPGFFEPPLEEERVDEDVGMEVDGPSPADAWDALPRREMEIEAPTPRLNPATGLVELQREKFLYSYRAQVDGNGDPLAEENQPDCQPLQRLMKIWAESERGHSLSPSRLVALTQAQFDAMESENMASLVQDVFIVRDEDSVVRPSPLASPLSGHPPIAFLEPYPPYIEGIAIHASSLGPLIDPSPAPLSPILLDFCLRFLHHHLRQQDPVSAAAIRLAPSSLWARFLQYRDLARQAENPGDALQTDEDEGAVKEVQTQILRALGPLDLRTARYLVIPQYDERETAFAIVVGTPSDARVPGWTQVLQFVWEPPEPPKDADADKDANKDAGKGSDKDADKDTDKDADEGSDEDMEVSQDEDSDEDVHENSDKGVREDPDEDVREDPDKDADGDVDEDRWRPMRGLTQDFWPTALSMIQMAATGAASTPGGPLHLKEVQWPAPDLSSHKGFTVVQHWRHLFDAGVTWVDGLAAGSDAALQKNQTPESAPDMKFLIAGWLVRASGPKGFSRFPSEAWSQLPRGLSYMRQFYASDYLYRDLGLTPGVEVDVHDLRVPPDTHASGRLRLPLRDVACNLLDGPSAPRWNLLSLPSSTTHGHNRIMHALADDNRADVACSTAGLSSTLTTGRPIGAIQWTILSAPGTYHPPHRDANGYHTVLQVLDGGAKLCAFARRRTKAATLTPRPGREASGWEWEAFRNSKVTLVVLKEGDRAIMPPGLFHSVFTVDLPSLGPRSVVMSGSHFLSRHTLDQTLYASISHAFWHDVWTNATHDDRDYAIARMLAWHLLHPTTIFGANLHALLLLGTRHRHLRSLPWKTSKDPSWLDTFNPAKNQAESNRVKSSPAHQLLHQVRKYMEEELCPFIYNQMSASEQTTCAEFWDRIYVFYAQEFDNRRAMELEPSASV